MIDFTYIDDIKNEKNIYILNSNVVCRSLYPSDEERIVSKSFIPSERSRAVISIVS